MPSKIVRSVLELIGDTPLLALERWHPGPHRVLAKLEFLNPGGSVKDRTALAMIRAAERDGSLLPGGTIIEPTAGNTGIGLALVAAVRGYRTILVVPRRFSLEKQELARGLGAEIVHTPTSKGMEGAIAKARELAAKIPGAFVPQQFANPHNREAHAETTGPEIDRALDGKLDALVIGVGTCGTLMGAASYLKKKRPGLAVYAVEPQGSILGGGRPGRHKIEGIGVDDLSTAQLYDPRLINGVITVSDRDAHRIMGELARTEGLLVGSSAAAAAWAARKVSDALAENSKAKASTVVTLFPDGSERYLSKHLYGRLGEWKR